MGKSIKLSKIYGLNPSITRCECCGRDYGVALLGAGCKDPKTHQEMEAPREIYNGFCNECKSVIDKGGVLIIEIYEGTDKKNPKRTGRYVGCSSRVKEMLNTYSPMAYMEQPLFKKLFDNNLPKPE